MDTMALKAPTLSSTLSTASILYGGGNSLTSIEQNTIIEKLKELHKLLATCEERRIEHEENLDSINKTQERMQNDNQKLYYKQKLKGLYKTATEECDKEAKFYEEALNLIFEVKNILKRPRKLIPYRNHLQLSSNSAASNGFQPPKEHSIRRGALMKLLHQQAQTLPLFITFNRDERPPPLCGCMPAEQNYVGKIGDMVAALVKSTEGEENWILAEIVNYNSSTSKYEIDDIDEEQKERHILSKRKVVPLPLYRANPETHPQALWPRKSIVLALYPQTTCFYRAIVQELPKTATDQYKVLFEDSSYQEGFSPPLSISQRFIIKSQPKK